MLRIRGEVRLFKIAGIVAGRREKQHNNSKITIILKTVGGSKIPGWIAKVKTVVFLMKTHGEISAFKLDYAPNDYAGGKEKYRYKEANAREC